MQNEGKVRNCHTDDMNGKCEKPRSYFCQDVDALGENEMYSEEQQAVGTHKGTAGEGGLTCGGAGRRSTGAVPEAEQSPRGGRGEAGKGQRTRQRTRASVAGAGAGAG